MAPVLWGVQESQDGSWERLSLQRIHCGTGELCSGRGLRNATEDSLIRVSSSALGQRLRSAPADFDPRRRFASVHSASDSTSPSRRIAAAELFTDAQTRHWAPLQSIRLGWRWTLWMRQEQTQYPSFAGARQVAGVTAGQGGLAGLLVAMPPPPWQPHRSGTRCVLSLHLCYVVCFEQYITITKTIHEPGIESRAVVISRSRADCCCALRIAWCLGNEAGIPGVNASTQMEYGGPKPSAPRP